MVDLSDQYMSSLQRLCTTTGAQIGHEMIQHLIKTIASLTQDQIETSIALYEYHTRRILATRARVETEEMLKNMRQEKRSAAGTDEEPVGKRMKI